MLQPLMRLIVAVHLRAVGTVERSERGQSTVEYALVLLGLAVVLGVVFKTDLGTKIGELFGFAIDKAKSAITG